MTVMAGWGGAFALAGGPAAQGAAVGPGAVLTWALPEGAPTPQQVEALVTRSGPIAQGERLYHHWCARCHGAGGVSGSALPDLRASLSRLGCEAFDRVARARACPPWAATCAPPTSP